MIFTLLLTLSKKKVDLSKLKAFADDNLNVSQAMEFVFSRLENIVEKGENAGK